MTSNNTSMDPTDPGTPNPTSNVEQPTSTADTSAPPVTTPTEPAPLLPHRPPLTFLRPRRLLLTPQQPTSRPPRSSRTSRTTTSDNPTSSQEPPSSTPPTSTDNPTGGGNEPSKTTVTRSTTAAPTTPTSGTTTGPPSTTSSNPSLNDGNSGNNSVGGTEDLWSRAHRRRRRRAPRGRRPARPPRALVLAPPQATQDAEELRRKEVEEYGYNPNNDPTLPAIGMESGYRGWGTTTNTSGRKASTTMSGGAAGAYSEGAQSQAPVSDTRSDNALVGNGRPQSDEVEQLGAMGPSAAGNRGGDIHRGVSNASSSYSAGHASDGSDEQAVPGGAYGAAQYYSNDGPYADQAYGGRGGPVEAQGQPVIRDNLARRATRIENPSHFPTQASAGISQNF
ncbi:hypothetical protein VE04_08687 [Pseudogymnoascus sp. 24MN13]|nr:hypothetical protein VE04_08687 [Pseudogymnoascus sp. 24MN13]